VARSFGRVIVQSEDTSAGVHGREDIVVLLLVVLRFDSVAACSSTRRASTRRAAPLLRRRGQILPQHRLDRRLEPVQLRRRPRRSLPRRRHLLPTPTLGAPCADAPDADPRGLGSPTPPPPVPPDLLEQFHHGPHHPGLHPVADAAAVDAAGGARSARHNTPDRTPGGAISGRHGGANSDCQSHLAWVTRSLAVGRKLRSVIRPFWAGPADGLR
jgi:hypothetical protein